MVMGGGAEVIRYVVAHDAIIGVAIRFRQDAHGLGHCQSVMTQLRALYGAPNQHREVFSAPEARALIPTAGAGPKMAFSTVHKWFATRDTEAHIEIACPAQAQSFAGYLQLIWTARVPHKPEVSVTSALSQAESRDEGWPWWVPPESRRPR